MPDSCCFLPSFTPAAQEALSGSSDIYAAGAPLAKQMSGEEASKEPGWCGDEEACAAATADNVAKLKEVGLNEEGKLNLEGKEATRSWEFRGCVRFGMWVLATAATPTSLRLLSVKLGRRCLAPGARPCLQAMLNAVGDAVNAAANACT